MKNKQTTNNIIRGNARFMATCVRVVVDVVVVFITLTDRAPTIFINIKTTVHAVANPLRGLLDREAN